MFVEDSEERCPLCLQTGGNHAEGCPADPITRLGEMIAGYPGQPKPEGERLAEQPKPKDDRK